ncbi:hypothetical protein LUZ60_008138 [Juncus effusus]|nr:hypothetical protein LUZ60_008138 [Juncus effusus]
MKLVISPPAPSSIVSAIKSAIANKSLVFGESVHAQFTKAGLSHEINVWNHLVELYAKCNKLKNAQKLFDETSQRDLVSYSVMISSMMKSGKPVLALELLNRLNRERIIPNKYVLSSSILACSKLNSINFGQELHAHAIISGNASDPFVSTALIDMYSKCGCFKPAIRVFDSCGSKDTIMITSMISNYISYNAYDEALVLFTESMRKPSFRPTEFTFSSLIKACFEMERETGEQIHGLIVKIGVNTCRFVSTSLLDMYAHFGEINSMEMIFDAVPNIDIPLYNALIGGYSKNALDEFSLRCLKEIMNINLRPNEGTLSSILNACGELKSISIGTMVHGMVQKTRFMQDLVVNTALIDMYMKCGTVKDACKVFELMPDRNTITYNTMIFGLGQNGNFDESLRVYVDMKGLGVPIDVATFVALSSCSNEKELSVYAHAIKHGFGTDLMVQNATLDSLLLSGAIKESIEFFEKLEVKSVISWTTIISGLANAGLDLDSIQLFKTMLCTEIRPNGFTFSSVLKSCSNLSNVKLVRCIHGASIKCGSMDPFTCCALIDSYSRCGTIDETKRLFDTIDDKNLVHYNAMITGFSQNGFADEALGLYADMEMQNVGPNEITFISLLSACSRSGSVDIGIKLFDEMRFKYCIEPSVEHFSCMVDLLGRAGLLDQALEFIHNMPFKPDESIWCVFLGLCKIHGNSELAKFAVKNLIGLHRNRIHANVVMSNIFSELGKWDDAQKARGIGTGLVKEPGLSWVM